MQIKKSHNANNILINLKKLLKIKTDRDLASILNIKPNTISTWKRRDSVDYSLIIDLCKVYKLDLNLIFHDYYEQNSSQDYILETFLVSRETLHEYTMGKFENNLSDLPKFSFPFIKSEDSRAFQVISNNMFPIIEENSFAICEKITLNTIRNNDILALVSKQKGFFINRIKLLNNQEILLINENYIIDGHSFKMPIEAIDEFWIVKGTVSYNVSSDNKLQFISNSVKRIEKFIQSEEDHYL